MKAPDKKALAYIIGVALGDGNLSNPNGRAVRLRITCDTKYPNIIKNIIDSIQKILPNNKVSVIHRAKTYIDISCYSNKWESWLDWKANEGSKIKQEVRIPKWIRDDSKLTTECLRGLFETDGSIYLDRKYKMVNFTNGCKPLADDVFESIKNLGYEPKLQITELNRPNPKYTVRLSRQTEKFIKELHLQKTRV